MTSVQIFFFFEIFQMNSKALLRNAAGTLVDFRVLSMHGTMYSFDFHFPVETAKFEGT